MDMLPERFLWIKPGMTAEHMPYDGENIEVVVVGKPYKLLNGWCVHVRGINKNEQKLKMQAKCHDLFQNLTYLVWYKDNGPKIVATASGWLKAKARAAKLGESMGQEMRVKTLPLDPYTVDLPVVTLE